MKTKPASFRLIRCLLLAVAFCISPRNGYTAIERVTSVPWQGNPLKYHTAIDGISVRLKGVVRTTDNATVWYKWVFGDGTESAVRTLSGSRSYNVEADHVYSGSVGTPFTARLFVDAIDSSFANAASDPYLVKIEPAGLDSRVNIAIDNGLWFLHKQKFSDSRTGSFNGQPVAVWSQSTYGTSFTSPTASAIHAFQINGHKQTGNPDEDPYVSGVKGGLNWLFNGFWNSTSQPMLRRVNIALQRNENPDANGNGIGIDFPDTYPRAIYQGGMVMDAIIASGTPDADCGRDFDGDGATDTYREVVQDMCDMYAWGQCDSGDGRGGILGGWRYNWQDFPDNSASQWAAIGMIPAQQPPWNCVVPSWVKTHNNSWLNYSHSSFNGGLHGGFGYTGASHGEATTPAGMIQLVFVGAPRTDPRWVRCERWFADNWLAWLNGPVNWTQYGYYSFVKAMLLALPGPVTTFTSNGFDWYRGAPGKIGLAQRLSDRLVTSHFWPNTGYHNETLMTAWVVIMLRPVLFQEAPIACFSAQPNPNYPDLPIEFDPACSGHSDPAKTRDNLVLYEWDWNSDGTFDEATTKGEIVQHSFGCATLPCIQAVTLRVTDDVGNTATYRHDIEITNPPHPPVARLAGPYMVSLCEADTLLLDASGSFDVDQGMHEAGCPACPNDQITAWQWDLDGAPFTFTGPTGPQLNLGNDYKSNFPSPGTYDIGVRVLDNTSLAFPGSGKPSLSDEEFSQVFVYKDGVCNLRAVARCEGVDLAWDAIPGASYLVFISASGPNRGFVAQPAIQVPNATLQGFPLGVSRWIRVAAITQSDTLLSEVIHIVAEDTHCVPVADPGGPYAGCVGTPLTLNASSSFARLGSLVSAEWDLDNDGEFDDASGFQIQYAWNHPGTYPIRVKVTSGGPQTLSAVGESSVAIEVCECVQSFLARAKLNKIQLTWKPVAGAASYDIYRSITPWFTPSPSNRIAQSVVTSYATYLDENLPVGTTYFYRVTAVSASGQEICFSPEVVSTSMPRTGNVRPAANAGPDRVVPVGSTVMLDGSASFDGNSQALTYRWRIISKPAGSTADLSAIGVAKPSIVADVRGAYQFELIVNDGQIDSTPDTVRITTQNSPPQAVTSQDINLPVGSTAVLDGRNSTDPDGDALTYQWFIETRPTASSAQLIEPTSSQPSFVIDSAGIYTVKLIVRDGLADSLPAIQTVRTVNSAPVARIAANTLVPVGSAVQLDGTSSSDIDGDPLSFLWSLTAIPDGSAASLPNPTSVAPSLTPDKPGNYQASLIVNDGTLSSVPALLTITANGGPIANAGEDRVSHSDILVNFDGSASTDPENDPLTYLWTITESPDGSQASLVNPDSIDPSLTPDRKGQYKLTLVVSDALSSSAPDEILLNVVNTPPVANAGLDREVPLGSVAAVTASASSDADGDTLSYSWSIILKPAGSGATLGSSTGVATTLTPDLPGTYHIQLVANDGETDSAPHVVHLTTANRPPIANAGASQTKFLGENFTLDGSASTDPDGDLLNYSWSLLLTPDGSTAQIQDGASTIASLLSDAPGLYRVQLVVSDPRGGTASATVDLTAKPFAASPSLVGLTEAEARTALEGADLIVGQVIRRSDQTILAGIVLEQVPPVGTKLDPGAAVDLIVSSGPDAQAPAVTITANPPFAPVGSLVTLTVNVVDDGQLNNITLTINGVPLPLTGNQATFVPTSVGTFHAEATASDTVGNVGHAETTFYAVDPTDTTPPTVVITAPADDSVVTAPTAVTGSVFDPSGEFASYTVDYAPVAKVNMTTLESEAYVQIGHGTAEVHGGTLAQFDPTLLANDAYVIRVSAWDENGQSQREYVVVNVSGNLKFGEFRLEFTDLTVPVAGIPIEVKRVYDSRQSADSGDFGYGWSLGIQDARIRETLKFDGFANTFYPGTRVYINTPDGRRVGFTAFTKSAVSFGFVFAEVAFQADPGVYEKLEFTDRGLAILFNGFYLDGLADEPWDPDKYKLTTKDGKVYEYSQALGLQKVTDLNGNRLEFTSAGIFHYASGQTAPGQKVDFVRDSQGRIQKVIDPAGNEQLYFYDAAGDLRSFTDQVANLTQYTYHSSRAHYLDTIIDPLGHAAIKTEYDASGRVKSITDAAGNKVTQDLNLADNVGTFTDARGTVIFSQYDDRGNETLKWLPGIYTNRFEFDANNNLTRSINGRGYETNFTYDARGNFTSIKDPLGHTTTISYNAQNKPTTIVNALNQTLTLNYDPQGELLKVINNAGFETVATRDFAGRLTSLKDAAGNITQFIYEGGCGCGKPRKVINADGSFRLYQYDTFGQTTSDINELGAETKSEFDNSGRLSSTTDPLGNKTIYTYTGPLLASIADPLGRTTHFEYDSHNRTNKIIDAEGGVVEFRYDANGNRTHVIDPVGNVTRFIYDAANRLIQQIDPLGHTSFFSYDAEGNRIEAIDRNGRRRTFAYDTMNRMTNELWWEGPNVVRSISFGFNRLGGQTLAEDAAARYEYSYDSLNRLERVLARSAGVPDFTLLYTYTALAQVESVTDNWGLRVGSSYDNRNRLSGRTWSSTLPGTGVDPARVDFAYDGSGNRVRTDRFADLAGANQIGFTTNAYNRAGIVTNITHLGPASQILAKYDYDFDAAFQITRWTINSQPSVFNYDLTGQLTDVLNTAQANESFRFDANGNRLGAQSSGQYLVGGSNQLLFDGTNSYAYDMEGNMTSWSNTVTGVLTVYQWDHRNRLVTVLDYNPAGVVTQTVAFVYDAMNRRLTKTVNGQTTRFYYNGDDSWADLDGANTTIARYLHGAGIDELLARQRVSDGPSWYLTDHIGTVRDVANTAGAIVAHVDYTAFGQVVGVSNPGAVDRFLFTGRELDREVGLYFYRARYYSKMIGRFVSSDPIGFSSQDLNLYRYVHNRPISSIDPFGTTAFLEILVMRTFQTAQYGTTTVVIGRTTAGVICIIASATYTANFPSPLFYRNNLCRLLVH